MNEFSDQRRRLMTIAVATKVIAWPLAIGWLAFCLLIAFSLPLDVIGLAFGLLTAGAFFGSPFVIFVAEFIGWFASRFFGERHDVAMRIAITFAVIVDVAIVGWVLVLSLTTGLLN